MPNFDGFHVLQSVSHDRKLNTLGFSTIGQTNDVTFVSWRLSIGMFGQSFHWEFNQQINRL